MKRKRYFIKKRYQGKFIIWFLLVSLLGTLVATYLFDYMAKQKIDYFLYSMRLPSGHSGELLLKEMLISTLVALAAVVAGVCLVAYHQIQKAKGPMGRIAQEAESMLKGDLITPVRLRQGDEFHEILPSINGFKGYLRQRFLSAKRIADHVESLLRDQGHPPGNVKIQGLLQEIRAELNAMRGEQGEKTAQ